MTTPRPNRLLAPKRTKRDYLNIAMHLVEAAYWFVYCGILLFADADIWVYGATAIIAVPLYAIGSMMIRARLGILR